MDNYLSTVAGDPFQQKNISDRARAERDARDAVQKQATAQAQARMAAAKQSAERPANSDIGYKFPDKFYSPKRGI
jgi:hypothetical protein